MRLEIVWLNLPEGSGPTIAPALLPPSPSPSPAPGGSPAGESTSTWSTDGPIRFNTAGLGGAAPGNLTFFALLNFTVPPGFEPEHNRVELWTKGAWVADAAAASPLGIVGIAHNGTLVSEGTAGASQNTF